MNDRSKIRRAFSAGWYFLRNLRSGSRLCAVSIMKMQRSQLSSLAAKYRSDKGLDAHAYTLVYEGYLTNLRDRNIVLLEIGLLMHSTQEAHGGKGQYDDVPSLRMWREYMPNAVLVGFDIACFDSVRISQCHIVQGDQSNREDLGRLEAVSPTGYDVIIDDGLHASWHQQISLVTLFRMLKPGGLYFIEDLNFQPRGSDRPEVPSTLSVLKALENSEVSPSIAISNDEWKQLRSLVEKVNYYDSFKSVNRRYGADALAVLSKRKSSLDGE